MKQLRIIVAVVVGISFMQGSARAETWEVAVLLTGTLTGVASLLYTARTYSYADDAENATDKNEYDEIKSDYEKDYNTAGNLFLVTLVLWWVWSTYGEEAIGAREDPRSLPISLEWHQLESGSFASSVNYRKRF